MHDDVSRGCIVFAVRAARKGVPARLAYMNGLQPCLVQGVSCDCVGACCKKRTQGGIPHEGMERK
ncbi:hypothetical protein A8P42_03985 [Treponema pallidum subsp. pallidum]|nr:hypothetical protein SD24_03980 [Treponema pallidum subsp. pallidum]ANI44628.1 hypothetical protein SD25_03975 [Treponema pallidum subsp. pallidum]ANI45593.1 hypothetical protein SD22_03965 [Treponema pallidum subsp. pallidum]ANI46564.1 hypothetical protein SD23_03970 [Treponema pallidum subsp. pallidum]ANI47526.1 hypothetical protein SD16_03970 [Treponema pallidum subsp. pallidum]